MHLVNGRIPAVLSAVLFTSYACLSAISIRGHRARPGLNERARDRRPKKPCLPVRVRSIRAVVDRNGRITLRPIADQLQLAGIQFHAQTRTIRGP